MKSPNRIARGSRRPVGAHLRSPAPEPKNDSAAFMTPRAGTFGVIASDDSLIVRFLDPKSSSGVQELNLQKWLSRPSLAYAIADYLASWGARVERATRRARYKNFNAFCLYLDSTDWRRQLPVVSVEMIDQKVLDGYSEWLNYGHVENHDRHRSSEPLHDNTKAQRFSAVLELVDHSKSKSLPDAQIMSNIRPKRNLWPGRHHRIQGHNALSMIDLALLRRACADDIAITRDRLEIGDDVRNDKSIIVPNVGTQSVTPYRDVRVRLKSIIDHYDGNPRAAIRAGKADPGLNRSMRGQPYDTAINTALHLHLTARALVPYIILLAIDGGFNAEGLLTLEWDRIEKYHPVFGDRRWRISAEKRRAGRDHRRSFSSISSDAISTVNLLKDLEKWARPTSRHLEIPYRHRVFIFWRLHGPTDFSAFDNEGGAAADSSWSRSLKSFLGDYNLSFATIAQLRITAADVVDEITQGDIKAKQVALGHASTQTTDRSYQSGTSKVRGREALAEIMSKRERYIATGGRADIRDGNLRIGGASAVTPGFSCAEPYQSPIAGQRGGRLCNAYGCCPRCPLAIVDASNPKSFIRLTQLRDQLKEAWRYVHPTRWLSELQPQLYEIDSYWLPMFSESTIESARSINLPELPSIE